MSNDIYAVSRDEYAGVVRQINPEYCEVEKFHDDNGTFLKIKNKNGIHYTTRYIPDDGEEEYYVFNLPEGEVCLAPKAIRKITLETKEEVQAFFDALNKIQEKSHND